jgi:hypothetical protein
MARIVRDGGHRLAVGELAMPLPKFAALHDLPQDSFRQVVVAHEVAQIEVPLPASASAKKIVVMRVKKDRCEPVVSTVFRSQGANRTG